MSTIHKAMGKRHYFPRLLGTNFQQDIHQSVLLLKRWENADVYCCSDALLRLSFSSLLMQGSKWSHLGTLSKNEFGSKMEPENKNED